MPTFDPVSQKPFRLSRSKLELFVNCPRCFYLDRRLGVPQPPGFPFNLNSAVDKLLKKEFDHYRESGTPHPLMKVFNVDAVPYKNDKLELWREALRGGIRYRFPETNLEITGAVDDLWINSKGELIIVDYKATSKQDEVTIDADWQQSYKRQMEIYQWLFKKNGYKVADTGYFVYANGDTSLESFNSCLHFQIKIIPYTGSTDWVDSCILAAYHCLLGSELPQKGAACEFCEYREAAHTAETEAKQIRIPIEFGSEKP